MALYRHIFAVFRRRCGGIGEFPVILPAQPAKAGESAANWWFFDHIWRQSLPLLTAILRRRGQLFVTAASDRYLQ
ncbi:MAG: hypothetical protein KDI10_12770, partial [Halioglobus sp.]|nr:hypothetical protein [Halioglobus sp.]